MSKFLFLMIAVVGMATACNKDNTFNDPNGDNGSGNMTAELDGENWSPDLDVVAGYIEDDSTLTIGASTVNGTTLSITLTNVTGTGTYRSLDNTFVGTYASLSTQFSSALASMPDGVLELTTFGGGTAKGTFSFTGGLVSGNEEVSVTNGSFEVEYINQ